MIRNVLIGSTAAMVLMAASGKGSGGNASAPAFELNDAHRVLLGEIKSATDAGNTRYVSQAEGGDLNANGYIEINPAIKDEAGNVAARLTDKGAAEVATTNPADNNGASKPENLFVMVASIEPPKSKRGGGGGTREPKYPLKDIPLGGALFVLPKEGQTAQALSKSLGSTVSAFNKDNPEKYLTARKVEDGAPYGAQFAGKEGVAIHNRPLTERKERAPRKPKTADNTAA